MRFKKYFNREFLSEMNIMQAANLREKKVEQNKFKEFIQSEETKEMIAFFTSQMLVFMVYISIRNLYPLYLQKNTSLSEAEIVTKWAIIISAHSLAGILTRIPAGSLIESLGRKKMAISAYLLMMISMIGLTVPIINTIWLVSLFIILKISNNVFGLVGRSALADIETEFKGIYSSLLSTFGRIGNLIGSLALGFILELFPPIFMLITAALITALGLIVFLILFREGEGEISYKNRKEKNRKEGKTKVNLHEFLSFTFVFFLIQFLIFGLEEGLTSPLFSIYGKNVLGLKESLIGSFLGVSQLAFIIISPLIGVIITKSQNNISGLLLVSSLITTANHFFMFIFYDSVFYFVIFLFVRTIGHALFFPIVITILTTTLPKDHFNLMYSVITTSFFVGLMITSPIGGVIYNNTRYHQWFYAAATTFLLVIMNIIYLYVEHKKSVST